MKVDAASGLPVLAARCDTASSALCAPEPTPAGPTDQATGVAVTGADLLVRNVLSGFATHAASTASAVRTAAGAYTGTDDDAGNHLTSLGRSIRN